MTKQERFTAALVVMASSYNRELHPAALEGYWIGLQDLSDDQMRAGMGRALRDWAGRFMPTAPELRALALGKATGEQRKRLASVSWEIVRAAMDKYDYTSSVDFGPLTNTVVRNMGGWQWLCNRSPRDLTFDRQKFEELHSLFVDTKLDGRRAAPLAGVFGGKPVLFTIPGEPERRVALPEGDNDVLTLVRDLANSKGAA